MAVRFRTVLSLAWVARLQQNFASRNKGEPMTNVASLSPWRTMLAEHGAAQRRPRCSRCNLSMRLSRRQSHPALGPSRELQTYTCATCGNIHTATAICRQECKPRARASDSAPSRINAVASLVA
jgi:hypothetical protein